MVEIIFDELQKVTKTIKEKIMSEEMIETVAEEKPVKKFNKKPMKRKVCSFCVDHATEIDYKDVAKLRRYITEKGKILPRRQTGVCARH